MQVPDPALAAHEISYLHQPASQERFLVGSQTDFGRAIERLTVCKSELRLLVLLPRQPATEAAAHSGGSGGCGRVDRPQKARSAAAAVSTAKAEKPAAPLGATKGSKGSLVLMAAACEVDTVPEAQLDLEEEKELQAALSRIGDSAEQVRGSHCPACVWEVRLCLIAD
jgi:hypothetical protein